MSELIRARHEVRNFHWHLLTTVCTLALYAYVGTQDVQAADSDRPTVWIELGGQLQHFDGTGDRFKPDFTLVSPTPGPFASVSPIDVQRPPRYSFGGEGKISIAPEHTHWVFSASVVYGRSNGGKHYQQQTGAIAHKFFKTPFVTADAAYSITYPAAINQFSETRARHAEAHAIVDFVAGKDVGLGAFGNDGSSAFSAGVRFAQFTAQSNVDIRARPDLQLYNFLEGFPIAEYIYQPTVRFHAYTAVGHASRSFRGLGPAISWDASAAIAGNSESAEVKLDWGVNAALLFGRQKASVTHQTTSRHFRGKYHPQYQTAINQGGHNGSHSVVVPNVEAFAGLSVNFPNSKVSFGYRGDFFFGAMDVGIDARKTSTTSFHGPFAKLSIGF
jgi:hypothetical protein